MKNKLYLYKIEIAYIIYLITTITIGFNKYEFMPQAYYVLKGLGLQAAFLRVEFHALRLLIAYPGYLLSRVLNVDLDFGYTIYIAVCFVLTLHLFISICNNYKYQSNINSTIILFIFCMLSHFMNGRIILAFLGFSMILYSDIKTYILNKCTCLNSWFIIFGALLSGVSSGTMTVIVLYLVISRLSFLQNGIKLSILSHVKKPGFYIQCLFFSVWIPYTFWGIIRNWIYFGGDLAALFQIIQHGAGKYATFLLNYYSLLYLISILLGILAAIGIYIAVNWVRNNNPCWPLHLSLFFSILGGIYGYSAGSLIIIPIGILFFIKYEFRIYNNSLLIIKTNIY